MSRQPVPAGPVAAAALTGGGNRFPEGSFVCEAPGMVDLVTVLGKALMLL